MTSPTSELLAPLFESPKKNRPMLVMGVLNVTPDSFSDGGKYFSQDAALSHALQMLDAGADILDIGGESTRPPGNTYGAGAARVSEEEEADRVLPIIRAILSVRPETTISIDTSKSAVARDAIAAGASIINDVSAGTMDARMFEVARDCNAPLVLMHGYGPAFDKASIEEYRYSDVVQDVLTFLRERISDARRAGVRHILADVGIGFAKTFADNMMLLKEHERFVGLGVPMVVGVSRKSSIARAMGRTTSPEARVAGSLAAATYCLLSGASIIRTHDVQEAKDAENVLQAILNA